MESQPPNCEFRIWLDLDRSLPATGAASYQYFTFRCQYLPLSVEAVPSATSWRHGECVIPRHRYLGDPRPFSRSMLSFMGVPARCVEALVTFISYVIQETAENRLFSSYRVLVFRLEISEGPSMTPFDEEEGLERVLRESAEQAPRTVPAAASSIEALKEMKVDARRTSTEWCTICLEELLEAVTEMPCSHVFHQECIVRWLKSSHLCPLCRHAMPTAS